MKGLNTNESHTFSLWYHIKQSKHTLKFEVINGAKIEKVQEVLIAGAQYKILHLSNVLTVCSTPIRALKLFTLKLACVGKMKNGGFEWKHTSQANKAILRFVFTKVMILQSDKTSLYFRCVFYLYLSYKSKTICKNQTNIPLSQYGWFFSVFFFTKTSGKHYWSDRTVMQGKKAGNTYTWSIIRVLVT